MSLSNNVGMPALIDSGQQGMVLLEALIAVLIFSLGLLGLAGGQASAIKAQGEAKARAEAAFVASQIVGDLWAVAPNELSGCAGTYTAGSVGCNGAAWGDRIAQSLPGGQAELEINNTQATITLTWRSPGIDEEHQYVHVATVARN